MMTTDPIVAASIAGFDTYHKGRIGYTWDTAHESVKTRWKLMVEDIATGTISNGFELREAYMDGIYAKSWAEIGPTGRRLWQSIYLAAVNAWHAAAAQEAAA